ncbi:Uncharacterised protein [Chlamydia trachomatis]|uniref:hypothetical protein n=1 Tax=Haemophilus haemolyticus TaxID=726 RepID=UPI00061D8E67|nr:hypothetical protein [Haemophilus haemolyticus]CRH91543.1 Uncharacterised protein [Chlamydia trachomatis]
MGLSALIFYFLFNAEFNKIPNDFAMRVAQGIRLSDEEKKELKRLFINMDFKQKKP